MEITMKPGKELDALIAENVMGLPVLDYNNYGTITVSYENDENRQAVWVDLPKYSTDITAAWEVAEKLAEKGFYYEIQQAWSQENTKRCRVYLNDGEARYIAIGDTAPHAICLAALKALGVEIE